MSINNIAADEQPPNQGVPMPPTKAITKKQNFSKVASEAIARILAKANLSSSALLKDNKSQMPCQRCGKNGVSSSHVIPESYLSSISELVDKGNKNVCSPGFVRDENNSYLSRSLQASKAATYPLFCNNSTEGNQNLGVKSCEEFFQENGETVHPNIESTEFYQAIYSFCEKLACSTKHKYESTVARLPEAFESERELIERQLKDFGLDEAEIKKTSRQLKDSLSEIIDSKNKLLQDKIFGPAQAIEWARAQYKLASTPEKLYQTSAYYFMFEKELTWHMADFTIYAKENGLYTWIFSFTMKVKHDGVKKDILVVIPLSFVRPRKLSKKMQKHTGMKSSVKFFPNEAPSEKEIAWGLKCAEKSALRLAKSIETKRCKIAISALLYAFSREEIWYSPSIKSDVEKIIAEKIDSREKVPRGFSCLIEQHMISTMLAQGVWLRGAGNQKVPTSCPKMKMFSEAQLSKNPCRVRAFYVGSGWAGDCISEGPHEGFNSQALKSIHSGSLCRSYNGVPALL